MSFTPENFTVWAEIPVTDLDRAMTFYNSVFDTELKKVDCEENEFAMFPTPNDAGIAGHLYPERGKTLTDFYRTMEDEPPEGSF